MATEYDLTTLERAAARVKAPPGDAELPALLTAASVALADWLGYEAHLREGVQETVPSEGGWRLLLRAGAVRQVTSITVDGVEVPTDEYFLESSKFGRIQRRSCRWPFTGEWTEGVAPMPLHSRDTGSILVTFDAGWRTPGHVALALAADPASTLTSDLPAPLEEACLITLTTLRAGAGRDANVVSRSVGSGSVTWAADRSAVPPLAHQLARPYYKALRRKV